MLYLGLRIPNSSHCRRVGLCALAQATWRRQHRGPGWTRLSSDVLEGPPWPWMPVWMAMWGSSEPGRRLSAWPSCHWLPAASRQAEDVAPGLLSLRPHSSQPRRRLYLFSVGVPESWGGRPRVPIDQASLFVSVAGTEADQYNPLEQHVPEMEELPEAGSASPSLNPL